ncbi:MAG: hypothetical protein PHD43_05540 [Methylococcales bacterium]|nr:hypothetical protein [Methylococcales bacterium]
MATTTWVKESAFGIWFLNTDVWLDRVLKRAINDLMGMLPQKKHYLLFSILVVAEASHYNY